MRKIFICLLAGMLFMSFVKPDFEKTADGLIVHIKKEKSFGLNQVRLQVINDKIIPVSATPDDKFSNENSLIVVPQIGKKTSFIVEEKNNCAVLSTASLKAFVNLKTGEVNFTDLNGNSVLRENKGG